MKIKEIMTHGIEIIGPSATIRQTAEKMKELDVGALPVFIAGEPVGMITDRDIVVRIVAHGRDPEKSHVSDAVTEGVEYCNEEDDINDVARLMEKRRIRRVMVTDSRGKVSGIVSLGDLAKSVNHKLSGEVLEEVSRSSRA